MSDRNQQILATVAHAYANAPAFARIMKEAGLTPADVQSAEALARVPITSKDRLVEMQQSDPPFGGWLAVAPSQLSRIYFSPGPLYDPQGFDDVNGAEAGKQALLAAGLGAGDIALNTLLYHMVPAGLWLDEALRLAGVTVVPLGPGNSDLLIMVMQSLRANVYVGTPSFLESVYAKTTQFGLTPESLPLRKAFFTAEPYLPAQRAKFEGEYGLHTSQAYGTADLGLVGFEKAGKRGFYLPDTLYVEIADPTTGTPIPDGELGEVVVTTFNRAYPLIRFGTGDLGVIEADEDGVRRIKGLFGRSGEAVKVRGMFLHPNQVRMLSLAFPAIRASAATITRQDNLDVLTIELELHPDATVEVALLAEQVKAASRDQARLRVDQVTFGTVDASQRTVRDMR